MKFQWTLICLHWFILTADLWNFNFLFILRLLEMESLSDNWLQWMEMIWSVLTQMRFALRGFAVKISICLGLVLVDFFFFYKMVCMRVFCSQHWNTFILKSSSMTSEYHAFLVRTGVRFNSLTQRCEDIRSSYVRSCWILTRRGHYVCWCCCELHPSNRLQVPRRLQLDCLTSHKCNNTWMNFCLCCLSVSPFPTPTPPLICVKGKEKNNCSMV